MRSSFCRAHLAGCALSAAVIGAPLTASANPIPLYRESFTGTTANHVDYGWDYHDRGTVKTGDGGFRAFVGNSDDVPGLNSCDAAGENRAGFSSPKTHDKLAFTTEFSVAVGALAFVSFDHRSCVDNGTYASLGGPVNADNPPKETHVVRNAARVALRVVQAGGVDGVWYVSNERFTTTDLETFVYEVPSNAGPRWCPSWETAVFNIATADFSTYDRTKTSAGRVIGGSFLLKANDLVTGFGLFWDGDTLGNNWFDNYTVNGDPMGAALGGECYEGLCGDGICNEGEEDECPVDCVTDSDGDGVLDDDEGLFTAPSDPAAGVPARSLGTNRWADMNGDGRFQTSGKNPTGRSYTMAETGGCSCAQIIEVCGYGKGHAEFGCSISVMDAWTGKYDRAGQAPYSCH